MQKSKLLLIERNSYSNGENAKVASQQTNIGKPW